MLHGYIPFHIKILTISISFSLNGRQTNQPTNKMGNGLNSIFGFGNVMRNWLKPEWNLGFKIYLFFVCVFFSSLLVCLFFFLFFVLLLTPSYDSDFSVYTKLWYVILKKCIQQTNFMRPGKYANFRIDGIYLRSRKRRKKVCIWIESWKSVINIL